MIKYLLLIFAIIAIGCYCQSNMVQVNFQVNVTTAASEYRTRKTTAKMFSNNLINGALIKSYEVIKTDDEKDTNAMRISIFAFNPVLLGLVGGVAPTTSIAYYSKNSSVSSDSDKNGYDFDVSASLSYMTMRLFSLEEVDGNGNVANCIKFNEITWSVTSSNIKDSEDENILPQLTLGGSSNNISIQINYVASSNYGTVSITGVNGGVALSPKGLDIVFSADTTNYIYANPANYLRLVIYTATTNTDRQTDVVSVNPNLPGRKNSYLKCNMNGISSNIRFDQRFTLGQTTTDIKPIFSTDPNLTRVFNGIDVISQINFILGANVQMTRTDVPFSAGVKGVMIYEPTIMMGTDPNSDPNPNPISSPTTSPVPTPNPGTGTGTVTTVCSCSVSGASTILYGCLLLITLLFIHF